MARNATKGKLVGYIMKEFAEIEYQFGIKELVY